MRSAQTRYGSRPYFFTPPACGPRHGLAYAGRGAVVVWPEYALDAASPSACAQSPAQQRRDPIVGSIFTCHG